VAAKPARHNEFWLFLLLSAAKISASCRPAAAEILAFGRCRLCKNSGNAGCYRLLFRCSSIHWRSSLVAIMHSLRL